MNLDNLMKKNVPLLPPKSKKMLLVCIQVHKMYRNAILIH